MSLNLVLVSENYMEEVNSHTVTFDGGMLALPYRVGTTTITLEMTCDENGLLNYATAKAYKNLLETQSGTNWQASTYGLKREVESYTVANDPYSMPDLLPFDVTAVQGNVALNRTKPGVYSLQVTDVRVVITKLDRLGGEPTP